MKDRDPSIDVLRGLAIVVMIGANMAPYVLEAPHPMPLRILGSFAAPTFVFLAGMMVGGSRSARVSHALRRSAVLFAVAAGIDVVCWGIKPFTSIDVLYLIGMALPISALCLGLETRVHTLLCITILVLTPIVRERSGYGPLLANPEPWPAWRRWLVDGWFPVFPWLGVALLGTLASRLRVVTMSRTQILLGGVLALFGMLSLFAMPPVLVTRQGYSELFYPPTIPFLCVAIGTLFLVLERIPRLGKYVPLGWLELYGRNSLELYVAQTVLIAFVFRSFFGPQRLLGFLALYFCHAVLLWGLARAIAILRNRELSASVTKRDQNHE